MDAKSQPTFDGPTMAPEPSQAAKAVAQKATNEALKDIAFGSFAGAVGKIVEYPFDTVKVRLQSQPDHLPLQYTGPLDCFRQSIRQEGFKSLYRGVSAPMVGAAAETASLFVSYSASQTILRKTVVSVPEDEKLPLWALVTAGGMAGVVTSVILTPIELVKCRMQAPLSSTLAPATLQPGTPLPSLSPFTVIRDVFQREGLRGFWRGQLGTFFRESGGGAAWFGGYEATSRALTKRLAVQQGRLVEEIKQLPISYQMLSGAVAGMSYNFIFFPADTIKSKIQTGELSHTQPTFWNVGKELWRAHGLKGLYRGCGITVARSAPSSALIFTIVEQLKTKFP
jgi:mitochondrial ornithine carrier protein